MSLQFVSSPVWSKSDRTNNGLTRGVILRSGCFACDTIPVWHVTQCSLVGSVPKNCSKFKWWDWACEKDPGFFFFFFRYEVHVHFSHFSSLINDIWSPWMVTWRLTIPSGGACPVIHGTGNGIVCTICTSKNPAFVVERYRLVQHQYEVFSNFLVVVGDDLNRAGDAVY